MPEEKALPVTDWRGADVPTYNTWAQNRALHQQGHSIRQIARGLDVARNTVREALRSTAPPRYGPRLARPSVVDPYRAYLTERAPLVGYNALAPVPGVAALGLPRQVRGGEAGRAAAARGRAAGGGHRAV